ncbi:MAG: SH3 domain-containing protein [Betaproteobacteria bacterium]
MRAVARLGPVLLALVCVVPAYAALEFRSIGGIPAILYDGPSVKANKIFVIGSGSPVEVVSTLEGWVKVRESGGELGWAEARALVPKRTVSISVGQVTVRSEPSESATPVFRAQPGLILELLEVTGIWARVRHQDGLTGYVRTNQVWGL